MYSISKIEISAFIAVVAEDHLIVKQYQDHWKLRKKISTAKIIEHEISGNQNKSIFNHIHKIM